MPIISMFFGIIIQMRFNDHNPPHIHATYQGKKAIFSLAGELLRGEDFPAKQAKLVAAWCVIHQSELDADWTISKNGSGELFRIDPLR